MNTLVASSPISRAYLEYLEKAGKYRPPDQERLKISAAVPLKGCWSCKAKLETNLGHDNPHIYVGWYFAGPPGYQEGFWPLDLALADAVKPIEKILSDTCLEMDRKAGMDIHFDKVHDRLLVRQIRFELPFATGRMHFSVGRHIEIPPSYQGEAAKYLAAILGIIWEHWLKAEADKLINQA